MGGIVGRSLRDRSLRRVIGTAALLAACTSDSTRPPVSVDRVEVIPPSASVPLTGTIQFTAVPRDVQGNSLSGRTVTWSSNNGTVAAVSAKGLVTGMSLGATTITATVEGRVGATAVTVVAGPAAQLVFTIQPAATTAGAILSPAIEVTARDIQGNASTDFTGNVTLALGANPSGAALGGTKTVAAVGGIATFPDLHIDKSGSGYTLQASAGSLPQVQTAAFSIRPGPVTRLVFTIPPSSSAAGVAIAPAVAVQARDAFGNAVPAFVDTVTVVLAANPGNATLFGVTKVAAVSGTALFPGLMLNRTGVGYTLATVSSGLAPDTSAAFAIVPGPVSASQSGVAASPSTITASTGSSVTTVTVTVRDAFGNLAPGVSVALAASGTGNTLGQPAGGVTDGNGAAHGAMSSTVAESKTVTATAAGVVITQTASVTVNAATGAALTFTVQPSGGAAGVPMTPPVEVTVRDAFGNTAAGFNGSVTVALSTNPGGAVLSGTTTRTATAGVATFDDLSLDKAGTGYMLTAAAAGATGATSNPFGVGAGVVSASRSTVAVTPGAIVASSGSSAATATVVVQDAFGNPIPGATVTLAATGTGNAITQPVGVTGSNGTATGSLSSTVAEVKVVTAIVNGIPLTVQPSVTVSAGPVSATMSTVSASPSSIQASGGGVASSITATARDAFANPVSGATVVLSATGSGNTLTQPMGATSPTGVATGALSSTTTGTRTVSATIGGIPITQTATVTVVPGEVSVTRSSLMASPTSLTASNGTSAATITIIARDDQGNPIPGVAVTLAATGTGNVLTQPSGLTDASGMAAGLLSSTHAQPKVISAVVGGTGLEQTDTVVVSPAPASAMVFLVQPSGTTIGIPMTPAVQVEIRDQFGNRQTTSTAPVTMGFGTNAGGATLSGGGPITAVAGVATFASLTIDKAGTGYTLNAISSGLPGVLSASFNVSAGVVSGSTSSVAVSPAVLTAGGSTSAVTVSARDAGGNPVVGATVTLSATGSGNTIVQPGLPTNASGVATGSMSSTGAGVKAISATASGVVINQKPTITVNAGPVSAGQSNVSASPASIEVGAAASIIVTAHDAYGNPVSSASVALVASGSGVTLTQPSAPTDATGVALGSLTASATGTKTVSATVAGVAVSQTASVSVVSAGSSVTFVGAGDIADCGSTDDEATAALIAAMPSTTPVFVLGDNAYPNGSTKDFANCYDPSWGAFKSRTHPSAGNHEYNTSGAVPYFAYFGAAAGPSGLGYYSFNLGAWHVVVLNSNIASDAGSAQDVWLRNDLATHSNMCTLAYFHHPLYSSIGGTGSGGATISSVRRFWDDLYAAGVDLILNGHRHVYERLAPMKPDGTADPVNGIRTIIAGMGGESGGDLTNIFSLSEVREGRTFGVLKLTLRSTGYDWQFIGVPGSTFTDSGTNSCH